MGSHRLSGMEPPLILNVATRLKDHTKKKIKSDFTGNEETARMVREFGAVAFADVCDVSKEGNVKEAAQRARENVGEVTILVNNAGRNFCLSMKSC